MQVKKKITIEYCKSCIMFGFALKELQNNVVSNKARDLETENKVVTKKT